MKQPPERPADDLKGLEDRLKDHYEAIPVPWEGLRRALDRLEREEAGVPSLHNEVLPFLEDEGPYVQGHTPVALPETDALAGPGQSSFEEEAMVFSAAQRVWLARAATLMAATGEIITELPSS